MIDKLKKNTKLLIELICVLMMATMSIMVFLNVVLRYGFNSSLVVSEELSRYLFIWLTFLASILAYIENQHVAVDYFVKKFGIKFKKFFTVICDLLILVCCAFVIHGSLLLTQMGAMELSPVTSIPMSYVYLSGLIGGIGIGFICIFKLIADIKG